MWSVLTEVIHERGGVAQWVVRLTRKIYMEDCFKCQISHLVKYSQNKNKYPRSVSYLSRITFKLFNLCTGHIRYLVKALRYKLETHTLVDSLTLCSQLKRLSEEVCLF